MGGLKKPEVTVLEGSCAVVRKRLRNRSGLIDQFGLERRARPKEPPDTEAKCLGLAVIDSVHAFDAILRRSSTALPPQFLFASAATATSATATTTTADHARTVTETAHS
jgi:hypothetical protein